MQQALLSAKLSPQDNFTIEEVTKLGQAVTAAIAELERVWSETPPPSREDLLRLLEDLSRKSKGNEVGELVVALTRAADGGAANLDGGAALLVSWGKHWVPPAPTTVQQPEETDVSALFEHQTTYAPIPMDEKTPRRADPPVLILKRHHRDALASPTLLLSDEVVTWAVDMAAACSARRDVAVAPTDDLSKWNNTVRSVHGRRVATATRTPTARFWVMPCFSSSHFVLLIADLHSKEIFSLDSLRHSHAAAVPSHVESFCHGHIRQSFVEHLKQNFEWPLRSLPCAQQTDSCNCGVFVAAFADLFLQAAEGTACTALDFRSLSHNEGSALRADLLKWFDLETAVYLTQKLKDR
jgi:hypothetical protein